MKNHLTRNISILLIGAVIVTTSTIGAVLFWMSAEHDRVSAQSSQIMISGGLDGADESLQKINVDYSWWQDAYDNVIAENSAWVSSNMQVGVTESGTTDLLVIVQPDGSIKYSWESGGGDASNPAILDRGSVDAMVSSLAEVPRGIARAASQFMHVGDDLYLLSATRISPPDPSKIGDNDLPINIMGFRFDEHRVSMLGNAFLIKDLEISKAVPDGKMSIPLKNSFGEVISNLVWTPPAPGQEMLAKNAIPVLVVLTMFSLIAVCVARAANSSAKELARKENASFNAARTDALTGLPNRFCFSERLTRSDVGEANQNGELAVLFIDLNDFKNVNDTLGHAGGDDLISEVAIRMSTRLPNNAFLARVGGDEFTVIIVDQDPANKAAALATDMLEQVQTDFRIMGKTFNISFSIGIAVSDQGAAPEELIRRADVAMYQAKKNWTGKTIEI